MTTSKLQMIFNNQMDRKTTLSIDNPRTDLTPMEVDAVMNDIITRNVFSSTGGDLVAIASARVVTTDVQDIPL